MNFKLILITCAVSVLMLSGCDKTKETAQASKEVAGKAAENADSAVTGKVDEMVKGAADKMANVVDTTKATVSDATQEAFDAALSAAKELTGKATEKSAEWRDTGKLLKTAEKAASEGDFAKAIKLANTAKMQAEAALQQSDSMQNAGPRF